MTSNQKTTPTSNGYKDHSLGQAKKRPTIGFLASDIHLYVGLALWTGIFDTARKHDVNLVCFPGGTLRDFKNFAAQRNILYDLVNTHQLDGVISWGSILGMNLSRDEIVDFHRPFQSLPLASLTLPLEGVPTLLADTYLGMREIMVHLIETHGYRRIAFIRGPKGHPYAEERYQAYLDTLKTYDIPLNEKLITPPIFWDEGAQGAEILLKERKLRPQIDFEAVVATNDHLAFSALRVMQAMGIQVPEDAALTGFDDSTEGRTSSPPLTSVTMPFYQQGKQVVEVLLAQMAGEPVDDRIAIPAQMVVRQSCGCPSQLVMQAAVGTETPAGSAVVEVDGGTAAEAASWAAHLEEALLAELNGTAQGLFLGTLGRYLRAAAARNDDVITWHRVISAMRRSILPTLAGETRLQAEDLWEQARVLISETAQRAQAHQQLQAERLAERLRNFGQALIATFDLNKLLTTMAEHLPAMDIASCYLSLYEQPEAPLNQARLMLAYNETGRIELGPEGRLFPTRQLVPDDILPHNRRYSLVAEPLYFAEEQIGFVLFESSKPNDGILYEALREYLSSALHNILVNQQRERARAEIEAARLEAEQALAELQTIQQRYLQDAWQSSTDAVEAIQGYMYTPEEAGPTVEAWLPVMAAAVQRKQTVNQDEESDRTGLAVPIKVYNETIGVLGFDGEEAAEWGESEIAMVETIVEQVGLALENQRLLDEVQQTSRLLDKRITELDCLNDIGHEMGEASSAAELLQWITGRIPAAMQYPHLCRVAIEFEDQLYGAAEAVSLPRQMVHALRSGSEVFGRVYIAYTEKHDFLNEESALLGDIARRVSVYIENKRLLEQTQTRAHREQILREVTAQVHLATDAESIMRTAAQQVGRALGRQAFVYLAPGDGAAKPQLIEDPAE